MLPGVLSVIVVLNIKVIHHFGADDFPLEGMNSLFHVPNTPNCNFLGNNGVICKNKSIFVSVPLTFMNNALLGIMVNLDYSNFKILTIWFIMVWCILFSFLTKPVIIL